MFGELKFRTMDSNCERLQRVKKVAVKKGNYISKSISAVLVVLCVLMWVGGCSNNQSVSSSKKVISFKKCR